ncbi:MAG: cold shock domain-containing protein [Chloroflexi bacterium]|nr:cold shock domain-containing protein [Chloroflexota bacterium]
MTTRENGVVKEFSGLKGFGFIRPDGGGQHLIVHYSDIDCEGYASLYEGDAVSFERTETPEGPKAIRVRVRHFQ